MIVFKPKAALMLPVLLSVMLIVLALAGCESVNAFNSAASIKAVMRTPLALLALAILVWLLAGKTDTVIAARQGTSDIGLMGYLSHWKETAGAIGLIVVGWLFLIGTDTITDEAPVGVMFLAAVGLGMAPDKIMDLITKQGRSAELAGVANVVKR